MQENDLELEWIKFHWEVWREEATRFWKHLAFATVALLAFNLYQLDVLQIEFAHAKLRDGANSPFIKRWLVLPVSVWLWLSITFHLVDFLRHRVPEKYEQLIHNNDYPIPWSRKRVDLKPLARKLYLLVIALYLLILGGWILFCSIRVWSSF